MALTATQIDLLSELIGETYSATEGHLLSINAAQEAALVVLLTTYDSLKDKHLKLSGGRDGVDLDFDRDRQSLRTRARLRLGLSAMAASDISADPDAISVFNLRGPCWS